MTIVQELKEMRSNAQKDQDDLRARLDLLVRDTLKTRPLSYSSLKQFQKSPQHYIEYILKKRTATDAMYLGNLFDCILLTPERFEETYHVYKKIDGRTKAGKEQKLEIQDIWDSGKVCVSEDMYYTAKKMVTSVLMDDDAMYYIDKFKYTQSKIEWTHKPTGLKSIGYYDGESDKEDKDYFIADIKSAADASEWKFIKQAHDLGYHIQAGGYTMGAKIKYFKFPDFVNIVVESSAPYGVNVLRATKEYLELAQNEYEQSLVAFKYCLDNNLWHKSYSFIRFDSLRYAQLTLPSYFKPKFG